MPEYNIIDKLDNSDKYIVKLKLFPFKYESVINTNTEVVSFSDVNSNTVALYSIDSGSTSTSTGHSSMYSTSYTNDDGETIYDYLTWIFPIMQDTLESEYGFKWTDLEEGQSSSSSIISRTINKQLLDSFSGIFSTSSKKEEKTFSKLLQAGLDLTDNELFMRNVARKKGVAFTKGLKKVFTGVDFKSFNYEGTFIPSKNTKEDPFYDNIIEYIQKFKLKNMPKQGSSGVLTEIKNTIDNLISLGKLETDSLESFNTAITDLITTNTTITDLDTQMSLNFWTLSAPPLWSGYIYYEDKEENIFQIIKTIPLSVIENIKIETDLKNGLYLDGKPSTISLSFKLTEYIPFTKNSELTTNTIL